MEDLDLTAVCRVCLSTHKDMCIAADVGIIEKLFDCASVQLPSESLICQFCKTEVDKWHSFKQQVLKSVEVAKYIEESHKNKKKDSVDDNYAVIEEYFIKVEVRDEAEEQFEVKPIIASVENEIPKEMNTSSNTLKCDICESELCYHKKTDLQLNCTVPQPPEEDTFDPPSVNEDNLVILPPKLGSEDSKKFQCNLCHKSFISENLLTWHKQLHSALKLDPSKNSERFSCSFCPMIYEKHSSLVDHMKWKHNSYIRTNSAFCEQCDVFFKSKHEYRAHMRRHSGEKLYKCGVCKKKFSTTDILLEHSRIHKKDTPFMCLSCGKGFKKLRGLLAHQLIHNPIR